MRFLRALFLLIFVLSAPALAAGDQPLTIHTADGRDLAFTIELARTEQEREYGLMNRSSMAADHGMLFDFGEDKQIYMWMKNTLIPLDMIFIDRGGKVLGVAARAVPMSEAIIASPGPVRAVLEVNGGTADRLKIAKGDQVRHAMFGQ